MKRILIFYSYFAPAFKAGGIIQSVINLVEILRADFQIFIVCGARDMGGSTLLKGIRPDEWNEYRENVKVYYVRNSVYNAVRSAFRECNPDVTYINGMFLPGYSWLPLWFAKRQNRRVVMAPRGMLQKGALAIRPLKKKLFLSFFKFLGAHEGIIWHATDDQEQEDIKQIFGRSARVLVANVIVAYDVPKRPHSGIRPRIKNINQLSIVYLSLITEKKNLHIVLEALKVIKTPIVFDIYGPVKDESYWKRCRQLMESQVHQIRYLGAVSPAEVQDKLSVYHALVLPTKGENFGHAIYEALSAGTPAIISAFTPWGRLQDFQAGITVYSENKEDWANALQNFIDLDQPEFNVLSKGAFDLASRYFLESDFKSAYLRLFS